MMEVPLGDTYYFKFTTRAFATGVPTVLAGTPVISVYEENNLTQITAGITLTVDYDSVVGLNDVAVVATTGNGYEVGKYYNAVITTGTVGGVSVVGEVVGHFRVMPAEDAAAGVRDVNVTHWLDTAAATPTTAGVPEVDVTFWAGNAATASGGNPDVNIETIDAGLTIGTVTNVTNGVTLAAGAVTNASLAGNMEIVYETDFATNYNATRNAWATNLQDTVGTGNLTADVVAISGDTATADNLQILMDGNEGFYPAYMGPRGPGVYLNDAAANTSTTNGVDGTIGNPVSTIAAAKTLADSMSLDRIYLVNDSAITLAATMTDYEFVGIGAPAGNTIALASQDISSSAFFNVTVTGVQTGASRALFEDCRIGTATLHLDARRCSFTDGVTGITFSNNDDNVLDQCYSEVPGGGAPIFICDGANLDLSVRHYSGGIEIKSSAATMTGTLEFVGGQVIFNADCNTGSVIHLRGMYSKTDNTAGMAALVETAGWPYIQDDDTTAYDRTTDSLQAIRDHVGDGTNLTEAGGTGDHLTAIDLPNQTMDITGNITGNLSGSVGSVTGAVGSVTGAVGSVTGNVGGIAGTITTLDSLDTAQDTQHSTTQSNIAALNDISPAEVNAEVLDVVNVDTMTLPGQVAPTNTPTMREALGMLYKAYRNRSTQNATEYRLYADDATTVDQKATVSDDTTTADKGEVGTGP